MTDQPKPKINPATLKVGQLFQGLTGTPNMRLLRTGPPPCTALMSLPWAADLMNQDLAAVFEEHQRMEPRQWEEAKTKPVPFGFNTPVWEIFDAMVLHDIPLLYTDIPPTDMSQEGAQIDFTKPTKPLFLCVQGEWLVERVLKMLESTGEMINRKADQALAELAKATPNPFKR